MKLKHQQSVFWFTDDRKNEWKVYFTGTHGKLEAQVYRNSTKAGSVTTKFGHANKTQAEQAIKLISKS